MRNFTPLWLVVFMIVVYVDDDVILLIILHCIVNHSLSFCAFSFGHCVVCSSSIYGFWLPLWYLQILLPTNSTQHGLLQTGNISVYGMVNDGSWNNYYMSTILAEICVHPKFRFLTGYPTTQICQCTFMERIGQIRQRSIWWSQWQESES